MKDIPAFPLHNHGAQTLGLHVTGMSLRDYMAAKALQGIIASYATSLPEKELAAGAAYQYADAMMKAREA